MLRVFRYIYNYSIKEFDIMYDREISIGNWVATLIIANIPVVNLIMFFVWAYGNNTEKSKSNFAKAALILSLIGTLLYSIFIVFAIIAEV